MLVITTTSTENEVVKPEVFRNTLIELGLLAATVGAQAVAILPPPL